MTDPDRPLAPEEVRDIREIASEALGRRVSQHDLGVALGLKPDSAARRMRKWEKGEERVSGPATLALEFLRFAMGYPDVFNRYWRDRFISRVPDRRAGPDR